MPRYVCSVLVLGEPVMCNTIQAENSAEARKIWEAKFWSDPDTFRAEIPAMDDINRECATRLLALIEATRERAKMHGIIVTARPSRAAVAP